MSRNPRQTRASISNLVHEASFQLVAAVIRKLEFSKQYALPANPYELALEFGLERMFREPNSWGQAGRITHDVVEKRGEKEDNQLELAFRRIRARADALSQRLPIELVMI